MRLESLRITLDEYGEHKGKYTGKACFKGQYGGSEIILSPSVSQAVLRLCAEALLENTREMANNMTAEVIEGGALLENKEAA